MSVVRYVHPRAPDVVEVGEVLRQIPEHHALEVQRRRDGCREVISEDHIRPHVRRVDAEGDAAAAWGEYVVTLEGGAVVHVAASANGTLQAFDAVTAEAGFLAEDAVRRYRGRR